MFVLFAYHRVTKSGSYNAVVAINVLERCLFKFYGELLLIIWRGNGKLFYLASYNSSNKAEYYNFHNGRIYSRNRPHYLILSSQVR